MPTVVGVRLRFSKTLWFDPAGTEPAEGDIVIVETERGEEFGIVSRPPFDVEPGDLPAPLKPIVRLATDDDLAYADELTAKEREALPVFRELVEEYKLDMKPVNVEYLIGGDKIVFYFSAEERVDFRNLVKELANRFHARIDMRQVGVRDEARMVGGLGHCGEMLCCVRFGGEFQPVSIRMAKEQDLPLNPLKISGLCGRLMCCLRYEYDAYKDFKSRAPKRGAMIETPVGTAKVTELNTPKETIRLYLEGESVTVPLAKMECSKGCGCPCSVGAEALAEAGSRAVAATMSADEEPLAMPEPRVKERPKERSKDRSRERAKPAQPAEKSEGGSEPTGTGRRRRRRGRGGSGASGEGAAPQQAQQSTPKASAQPEGGAEKDGSASAGGAAKSGRRRRRRRPKGGGSTAE